MVAALVAISACAIWGLWQLDFDDDYKNIFRANTNEYARLDQFLHDFPADQNDLAMLLVADDVYNRDTLRAIRLIVNKARTFDEVKLVVSVFSIPSRKSTIRDLRFVFPEELHDPAILKVARIEASSHPLIAGELVSLDQKTMLVLVSLKARAWSHADLERLIDRLHTLVREADLTKPLKVSIAGTPAIRTAMRNQARYDHIVFNGLAAFLAGLVALGLFRSSIVSLAVVAGPSVGVVWTLGMLGLVGGELNVINLMVAPLVMVIGYTDAVHLMFHMVRLREGTDGIGAATAAIRAVGSACAWTSVTTAAGFGSLAFSSSDMIRNFGMTAAAGTFLTFLAVIMVTPLLGSVIPPRFLARTAATKFSFLRWHWLHLLINQVLARHSVIVVVGGLFIFAAIASAFLLRPDYRFREHLPANNEVYRALEQADAALGGVTPVNAVIQWPDTKTLKDDQVLQVIQAVQNTMISHLPTHHATSILDLLRHLPAREPALKERVPRLMYLPDNAVHRVVQPKKHLAVVNGRIPDTGAAAHLLVIDEIERELIELRLQYPDYDIYLTGLAVVAAKGSTRMIQDLARSLGAASLVIFLVMMIVLRSLRLGLISFLPNIAPLAGVAAMLVWFGQPLQYSTVLVFTICLGIAVDDTIHFLVRFQKERQVQATLAKAIQASYSQVAPVLIATTAILLAGTGALMTSETETVVRMGLLSCVALLLALLADLIFLPALLFRAKA